MYVADVLLLGKHILVPRQIKEAHESFRNNGYGRRVASAREGFTRDRENRTVTITHENYIKSRLERYGMAS